MTRIEVDHKTLRDAARAIQEYCERQDQEMRNLDDRVKAHLRPGWQGEDERAFMVSWDGVNRNGSAAVMLKESLSSLSSTLQESANIYRETQAEVYSWAARLLYLL